MTERQHAPRARREATDGWKRRRRAFWQGAGRSSRGIYQEARGGQRRVLRERRAWRSLIRRAPTGGKGNGSHLASPVGGPRDGARWKELRSGRDSGTRRRASSMAARAAESGRRPHSSPPLAVARVRFTLSYRRMRGFPMGGIVVARPQLLRLTWCACHPSPLLGGMEMPARKQRSPGKPTRVDVLDSNLLGVKSLVANKLYDAEGNYVGRLEEIVLDVRTGCVRHVVVAVGGFMGLGQATARRSVERARARCPLLSSRDRCRADAPHCGPDSRRRSLAAPPGVAQPRHCRVSASPSRTRHRGLKCRRAEATANVRRGSPCRPSERWRAAPQSRRSCRTSTMNRPKGRRPRIRSRVQAHVDLARGLVDTERRGDATRIFDQRPQSARRADVRTALPRCSAKPAIGLGRRVGKSAADSSEASCGRRRETCHANRRCTDRCIVHRATIRDVAAPHRGSQGAGGCCGGEVRVVRQGRTVQAVSRRGPHRATLPGPRRRLSRL